MQKILLSLFFVPFLGSILACSPENLEYKEIDRNYITFSYKGEEVAENIKDFESNGSEKKMLIFDNDLSMQDLSLSTTFEVTSTDTLTISSGMTFGFIKIKKNKIELYQASNNYQTTLIHEVFDLSPLEKNIRYEIGFRKTISDVIFYLKGGSISFEKKYDVDKNVRQNVMTGKPFFLIESGKIKLRKSILSSNYNKLPKVNVIGDSFIQGIALNQFGLSLTNRWCVKLANRVGVENCFIDGQGGMRVSNEWFKRVKLECSWYKSKYVILSIGTNNYNNINEYILYMKQTISFLKSNGQTPILVTVTPRVNYDFNSTANVINDWVKASGEKYVDIHKAVTTDEDGSKWNDGYVLSDGIHPTIKGYEAMYEQLLSDCPYLFN